MADFPAPERTPLTEPYWAALQEGRLTFQRCQQCRHAWLPPRGECPECLEADWAWEQASGAGRLVSWVIYHRAFHDWFRDLVPYNVAIVELEEGPRLISSVLPPGPARIDQKLALEIGAVAGMNVPRFRCIAE
ncbi:Zn-ribbon domain-containing OB-fold protein [Roseomonas sp. 18066]|uniref:Zn-ribbon domain-containing OB-fold protein n=1 Tax=Roseomonas sp. 18066 TaxID=2681412 RepID=UPI001359C636|nr:OB-fold domain-containing protein [Roseomonas sp. 18066]